MHFFRSLCWAFGLFVVLTACDGQPVAPHQPPAELSTAPEAPQEEPPSEIPVVTDGGWPAEFYDSDEGLLTPQELVGMWSTAPHCAQPKVFMADGTYTDYTGHTGRWVLDNERLTMGRLGAEFTNEVNQFDANTFTVGAPSAEVTPGTIRTFAIYRRC